MKAVFTHVSAWETLAATQETFRPYDPDQMLLLPPSVRDWVPVGDLAHFINDVTDELDLSRVRTRRSCADIRRITRRMMTKLWLYAYAVGQTSSRKLARLVQRDVGFMMLATGINPSSA